MQKQKPIIDLNLLCFCLINYFLNAAVSVIIPFYPPLAHSVGLSMTEIGYILAINPLGGFLFSIALGSKMSLWGRKFCMVLGLVIPMIFNI